MTGYFFFILILPFCYSQDLYPRPTFPDVFQTEIEGTFKEDDRVIDIDASLFYDREKNRAAFFMMKDNDLTRQAYNFDIDESITINANDCDVEEIPSDQGFLHFTVQEGKKKLSPAEEAFFFTKSKLDEESFQAGIPTLIYHAKIDIPQYGKKNCDVTHVFSKPDFELSICKNGWYCNSTILSISVVCKDENGETDVDHVYRFSRFKYNLEDESVFLPPPGIHCEMKNTQAMPPLPSYFSFIYNILEHPTDTQQNSPIFNVHKEIWYDADYKIVRIDEYDYGSSHFSSRLFDFNAKVAFTIVGSNPTCDPGIAPSDFKIDVTTRLPRVLFSQEDATPAVFVGQREVHGLKYQVWSLMWTDEETAERTVEEIYFLQIDSNKDISSGDTTQESYTQISHINMYIYDINPEAEEYKLVLLKHISINNYRTNPKEWSAFDVSSCFTKNQKKKFSIKIEKFPLVKGSQTYKKVLQLFYDKIIAATGVSVIRISELRGFFNGVLLLEVRGSILDNSKASGWPINSKEPGMEETFNLIKKAASEGKLTVSVMGQNKQENKIKVISVDSLDDPLDKPNPELYPKPTFPEVFQMEAKGIFKEDGVVEIDTSIFYDRKKNRAALFMLKDNVLTRQAYNFDSDEVITIDGTNCDVEEIPSEQGFFHFTVQDGKKKLSPAEESFFFTKSELYQQSFEAGIPTLIYRATVDIPQYGKTNCDVTHVFSRPDFDLPICIEGWYCNSTILSMSILCINETGGKEVDQVYRFSHFQYNLEDESVFQPPPGIHCEMKNTQPMPPFPSYFSFIYNILEHPIDSQQNSPIFNMHKEIWYDADYKIVRIDEFDYGASPYFSSRIFDLNAKFAFTIVGSNPTCGIGLAPSDFKIEVTTRLPKIFFAKNDTTSAVFVGQREVSGVEYQVWSIMWTDKESAERTVEEIYFIQIDKETSPGETTKESYTQISHIDMYTYDLSDGSEKYKLVLFKHFSISNYLTNPKEWSAFDISSCFKKNQKKEFSITIEKFSLVKGSQTYWEVLELFYDKIIAATGVSIIRISELRGFFDGVQLVEIRGSILDNSKASGWPINSKEPGMEETFSLIKRAASEGKLTISILGQNKQENKIKVISVDPLDAPPPSGSETSCFSGASMAASSLVLFLIGITFGIVGYYVFLKKRKLSNTSILMSELQS